MEEDHRKSLNDLIKLAERKSVVIPTSPTDSILNTYRKFKDKINFDVAYCDRVINMHRDAIIYFDKEYIELNDADIMKWITATFPYLQTDLDHALACQKKVQNKETITNR